VRRALVAATVLAVSLVVVPTSAADDPMITYTIDGIVGANGWYRGSVHGNNVVVNWHVTNYTGLGEDCLNVLIAGPTQGTTRSCTAWNSSASVTKFTDPPIKVDADPPTGVESHVARPADHNGWYNHPVAVTWTGSDATSGIASCSSTNYAGPEGAGVFFSGGCTDNAGNSTATGVTINYDATPPALSGVSIASTPDANVVRWTSSDPTAKVVVRRAARASTRRVVRFHGTASSFVDKKIEPGIEYVYTLKAVDQAGNESPAATIVGLPKVLTLQKMPYVPRAAPNPILRWEAVGGARYYNVQLFRGKKRVLAAWPDAHQFGVPKAWKWDGRTRRLRPGHYHWYVWAGFGARSFAQYRAVGSAQFIVPQGSQH
jgi:hypothetical protein